MNTLYKERMCKLLNISEKEFDELYSADCYKAVRLNPLKCKEKTLFDFFGKKLIKTPFYKYSYYLPKGFEGIGNTALHHSGGIYVQEPSASSVLTVVGAKSGEKILDLCAAPGGKSTGIGAELNGEGLLWSNEYVRKRASALLSNIERIGIVNSTVSSLSAEYLCENLSGFFDKTLVDAPCSGEGMWRHNPLVEKQWSETYVKECSVLQRQILSCAAKSIRPEGKLIYSTCTFSLEENEENVEWFLNNMPEFRLEKISYEFGAQGLGKNEFINSAVCRILPTMGGEGHFIAEFVKNDGYEPLQISTVKENITKEAKKILTDFLNENFDNINLGCLLEKNGCIYSVPNDMPLVKGDILRYGLFLGEIRKNRFEPAHSLFSASGTKVKRELNLEFDDPRLKSFLKGEEILADKVEKGYILIKASGCPLGFGKQSGEIIKNKYPKGLRIF